MFDHISFISVLTPTAIAVPFVAFATFFLPAYCIKRGKEIGENDMNIMQCFLASLMGTLVIAFVTLMMQASNYDVANQNAQTLNALQIEATDLNLPLKHYVTDFLEKAPVGGTDGNVSGLGAYSFLASRSTRDFYKHDFLTLEEFKVAQQYIRHCYPGEAGDIARAYMDTYPVEPHIVSKKLIKAQSLVMDKDIQRDCLNSVSLTFLK